jgi:hypothetical protein
MLIAIPLNFSIMFHHFGFYAIALKRRQIFHENLAQQMVHFVLNAHRQQAFGV